MKQFLTALFVGVLVLLCLARSASLEAATEKVIYAFCTGSCDGGDTDGILPEAGLHERKGKLYGTTLRGGGSYFCGVGTCGTVFSVDPDTGTETTLHAFGEKPNDGGNPVAGLILIDGTFYGTTAYGGSSNYSGTIYSIDPATGREKVLHSFRWLKAEHPGGLVPTRTGTLYGTTGAGGKGRHCAYGCGTVFSFDLSTGKYALVHDFHYNTTGAGDMARLLNVSGQLFSGQLYGTTPIGGKYGYGTVFSVNPVTRYLSTLYDFEGTDAPSWIAGLIEVNGVLYGTLTGGGASLCCGAVISIDPVTGAVKYLHKFCGQSCSDGANPNAGLVNVGSILYGTTSYGGTETCAGSEPAGCGTVFSYDLSTGTYSVLYSFHGIDGALPWAPLIEVNGTLYGTTINGGGGNDCSDAGGCGTVFSITP